MSMSKKKHILSICLVICMIMFYGCEGENSNTINDITDSLPDDTVDTIVGEIKEAFPTGLAIASLTSVGAGGSASALNAVIEGNLKIAAAFDSTASYSTKKAALDAIVNAADDAVCKVTLPPMTGVNDPSCYGPALDYTNHPNYDPNNTTDPNNTQDGQLPTGDLGIWSETEGTNNEACTAAKINKEIGNVASRVDTALLMSASLICKIKRSGGALPILSGTTDVTTLLNEALQANNANVTITEAKMDRLADVGSNKVFKYTLGSTMGAAGQETTVTTYLKHMQTSTDNSTFKGKLWAKFKMDTNYFAFSLLYEKTSTNLNYRLVSADYDGQTTNPAIFDSDGNIAVDGNWTGNIAQSIINLTTATDVGSVSYAWQAGRQDDKTRVFNAYTTNSGTDVLGYGYFGYGASRFDPAATTLPDNTISTFICNWAGPGNNHTGNVGYAQKQAMTKNATTGVFEATTSNITYAPSVSCDKVAADNFAYDVAGTTPLTNGTTDVTNELILLSADTDFSNYTAPTSPTDF